MAVERVAEFHLAIRRVAIRMAGHHDISPTRPDVVGEGDDAIRHGVNRIAEVAVSAGAAVPVLPEMLRHAQAQAAGFVVAIRVGFPDGKIKTIREVRLDLLGGGRLADERQQ